MFATFILRTRPRRITRTDIMFDVEKASRRDNLPQKYALDALETIADNPEDVKRFFDSIIAAETITAERGFSTCVHISNEIPRASADSMIFGDDPV